MFTQAGGIIDRLTGQSDVDGLKKPSDSFSFEASLKLVFSIRLACKI